MKIILFLTTFGLPSHTINFKILLHNKTLNLKHFLFTVFFDFFTLWRKYVKVWDAFRCSKWMVFDRVSLLKKQINLGILSLSYTFLSLRFLSISMSLSDSLYLSVYFFGFPVSVSLSVPSSLSTSPSMAVFLSVCLILFSRSY